MAIFEYKGLDGAGKAIAGIIDADSAKIARIKLRRQGLFPTDVSEQGNGGRKEGESILQMEIDFAQYLEFITARDISVMTTQLSTLVGAHVPMAEALAALVDQSEKNKLKVVLSTVKEKVMEGSSLADAMSEHPKIFNELYVQMVRAGEKSGSLDVVLKRLAKFADSQTKLQAQIFSAMAYPIMMGFIGTGILVGLFVFVIPRIRGLFDSMGGDAALPLLTRLVFLFGDTLITWWVWVLGFIFVVGGSMAFRAWVRTTAGRRRWDGIKLKMPLFGKMARLVSVSRFCRTLSTLLMSGVPIIDALFIVEAVVGNKVIEEAVSAARENIKEGQSIAAPLKASGQFPPLVTHMIGIGERTGELENMLSVVADSYEEQVEATIAALTSLLGPGMIMLIGGMVFVIALGLLQPMMNITSMMK